MVIRKRHNMSLSTTSFFSSFCTLLLFPSSCLGIFLSHRHSFNYAVSSTIFFPFHRQKIFPFLSTKSIIQSEFHWRNSAFGRDRNKVNNDDTTQHFSNRMLSSVGRREKVTKALLISGRDYSQHIRLVRLIITNEP
jgi:hypothetical protein